MWELTKSFLFEAAHSLPGTTFGDATMEIHGHSFRAEVSVRGTPDPATGMVLDLGLLERSMVKVRKKLDHKLLNESKDSARRRSRIWRVSSGTTSSAQGK